MKVLIVDDDRNIVESIQSIVPWEELGIEEVYEADQGQRALELIYEKKPDMVLSDVEMPVMDGLELAEKIASDPRLEAEVMFLTCHADFHYAQKAIQYGVREYLLKPFLPEELVALFSKAVIRCLEKGKQQPQNQNGETAGSGNQDYVWRSFIQDILDRTIESNAEEIRRVAKKRNITFHTEAKTRLLAVGIHFKTAGKRFRQTDLKFILRNIILEIFYGLEREKSELLIEYTLPDYYMVYMVIPETEYERAVFEDKLKRLNDVLKQYLELYATCLVSEPVGFEEYADKKEQMDQLLSHNVSFSSSMIWLEELEREPILESHKLSQQEIIRCLQERKKKELFLYLQSFLRQKGEGLDAKEMKLIHHDLMQVFYGYLYENQISTHGLLEDEISRKVHEAAEYSSIHMIKYAGYMYDYVIRQMEEVRESETVTERARKYIAVHYRENIGRNEVAEEVGLAPNYLGMLFRKETGQTIREYINFCRVEEAKRLMERTNHNITEMALQVGFDNITYFSTIFKKYTGLTPVEYRKNLQKKF